MSLKRGQIELSFGMIFSVILIIFFIVFAFYGIKTFLGFTDSAKAGQFFTGLQSDINRIWQSSSSSETQSYNVPSGVNFACFADFSSGARGQNSDLYAQMKKAYTGNENLFFYPLKFSGFDSKGISHIDIAKMVTTDNPYCITASNGKVSMMLKKDYGQALVTAAKAG